MIKETQLQLFVSARWSAAKLIKLKAHRSRQASKRSPSDDKPSLLPVLRFYDHNPLCRDHGIKGPTIAAQAISQFPLVDLTHLLTPVQVFRLLWSCAQSSIRAVQCIADSYVAEGSPAAAEVTGVWPFLVTLLVNF